MAVPRMMQSRSAQLSLLVIGIAVFSLALLFALASRMAGTRGGGGGGDVEYVGNQIVSAIEAYRVENGRLPGSLSQLVPKYIPKIEQPNWGTARWEYWLGHEKGRFVLQVYEGTTSWLGRPSMIFDSLHGDRHWHYDDAD